MKSYKGRRRKEESGGGGGGGEGGCDESLMIGHLNVSNSLRDINEQERNKYRERERWGSAPLGMMTCHLFASEGRRYGNESRQRRPIFKLLLFINVLLLLIIH